MIKLNILKDFTFAHHGYDLKSYQAGQEVTTDDDEFVTYVLREKWAKQHVTKARGAAPENKAA